MCLGDDISSLGDLLAISFVQDDVFSLFDPAISGDYDVQLAPLISHFP